jgi:hypothetical protein
MNFVIAPVDVASVNLQWREDVTRNSASTTKARIRSRACNCANVCAASDRERPTNSASRSKLSLVTRAYVVGRSRLLYIACPTW